jgi:hypothetical protein
MNGLPEGAPTDWITVSESLLTQIDEIPERLHYDHVKTTLEGTSLDLEILNASFRDRFYPSLRMSWDGETGKVTIHQVGDARPVFSNWPLDQEGRNRATCELFASSSRDKESGALVPLTKRDQAFLCALLGEVPNFLVHAAKQHPKSSTRLASLTGKSQGLRRKALKLKGI